MFRKILKISGIVLAALAVLFFGIVCWLWFSTSGMMLDDKKLKLNFQMTAFLDDAGETVERNSSEAVKLSELKKETLSAFIATEDRAFYEHNGINFKRIVGATVKNIASFSFKEGGSTISQQLIKNTHLTNEKTLKRKFAELRLTRELEKKYSKDEILELYLNSIYFGKCGYGISNAAKGFFGKTVSELSLAESASLAGVIKSPSLYSPYLHYDSFIARRNLVLKLMREQNMIGADEYAAAAAETFAIRDKQENSNLAYLNGALDECAQILRLTEAQINALGLRIHTNFNAGQQKMLEKTSKSVISGSKDCAGTDNCLVVVDNRRHAVTAMYSTNNYCAELRRQPASAIKPLLVYAPAIECGLIEPATLVEDKKTDIDGFSPSNYRDKYYGTVSARFALSNSLNVPAVKLLSQLGVDRGMKYLERNGMKVDKDSYHLASALGGFTEGMTLKELCAGYSTLANDGNYSPAGFVNRIETSDGKVLYERRESEDRVFSPETAFLVTDMLADTVQSGTGKALRSLGFPLSAKTGTNGSENGNRDAYSISYNKGYTVGVWIGSDVPFSNSVTGGTIPSFAAREVWQGLSDRITKDFSGNAKTQILEEVWGFAPPAGVTRLTIDGDALKKDLRFELADENAPAESKVTDWFKTPVVTVSTRYSQPCAKNFKVVREGDALRIEFFGEKHFSYKVYDVCGERKLLFEKSGSDETVSFLSAALKNSHRIEIVAVYADKKIEGEAQCSEEFLFPCDFVPDGGSNSDFDPNDILDKPGKSEDHGNPENPNGSGEDCWWW